MSQELRVQTWIGQYCLNVADLERSVAWYTALGLVNTSRTSIPQAEEAIVEHPHFGGKFQLAQQHEAAGSTDDGNAFWKLYVNTPDLAQTYQKAVAAGAEIVSEPQQLERWPVSVAFVKDPDGRLVELVQRRPWPHDAPTGTPWLGQYCLNVSDLNAAVRFYESLGLVCSSRTEIPEAYEAIVEQPGRRGGKLQLAQRKSGEPLRIGPGIWKLYLNSEDCAATYAAALAAGATASMEPTRLERWPTIIAFFTDPDGYLIEIVQRLPG